MACPFTLPRELGRRIGWVRLRWPRWLRIKWIGVGLMLAFFFSYERFALWDSPARTAWLLIAYVGTAFVVDLMFQGASFCKYVCPIGQFNFVGALLSPTTVRVRSQHVCTSCTTHDCIRGNATQRGCELKLFLPQKHSNADCTMCMDCVKACPHDNIGISPRSMTADLSATRRTSSLGSLDHRTDVAAVALVLVSAAFANAAVMVAPGGADLSAIALRMPLLATSALAGFVASIAVALCMAAVLWLASTTSAGNQRERFCRSALALVPLGMGMWAAHLLFHVVTSVPSVPALLQQATHDFGLAAFGQPRWSAGSMPGLALLQVQLLLLDAGLLLSLYVAWRSVAAERRMLRVLPLALFISGLYALGFWLLLAPMQMRGVMAMGGM
jgi:ferredoxin